jgi:hypothetical protein
MNFECLVKPVWLTEETISGHNVSYKIKDQLLSGSVNINLDLNRYHIYLKSSSNMEFYRAEGEVSKTSIVLNSTTKLMNVKRNIEAELTSFKTQIILSCLQLSNEPEVFTPITKEDRQNISKIQEQYEFITCIWNDGQIGERQSTKSLYWDNVIAVKYPKPYLSISNSAETKPILFNHETLKVV